ncbi:MAG TPA: ATP-binding protein, partial [Polyangiaceae bacterium]
HVGHALERRRWKGELDRVTGEFEALMYAISHDLGAPLRAVDGFSRALAEDYGPTLDDEAREHIDRVCGGAKRMAGLIDDLLHLARMSRNPMALEAVDLSASAEQILARLQRAEPARKVEVEIEPGLTTHGDKVLLSKALNHLLENAWKFTSKTENALIRFERDTGARDAGARESGDVPTFVVRDNGAGFEADYAGKLFAPFRRLHSPSEFEGRGIGLASVKRIVTRHGGEVWAEGNVGEGAAFFFTLPGA